MAVFLAAPLSLSINYQYMEKGLFELIPSHTGRGGGVHLGQMSLLHGWHLDNHSHSQVTTIGNLSVGTACLTCMSSGCGRRVEHSEESSADIEVTLFVLVLTVSPVLSPLHSLVLVLIDIPLRFCSFHLFTPCLSSRSPQPFFSPTPNPNVRPPLSPLSPEPLTDLGDITWWAPNWTQNGIRRNGTAICNLLQPRHSREQLHLPASWEEIIK